MQPRRARRAIIIDIVNRDLGHAKLIEYALTAGTIAIAVACDSLVDVVVVDLGVQEGFDAGFETEFGVIDLAARFDEFGQTYAEHVGWCGWFFAHGGGLGKRLRVWVSMTGWLMDEMKGGEPRHERFGLQIQRSSVTCSPTPTLEAFGSPSTS